MNKAKAKLIQKWEENPEQVIMIGAAVTTAIATLIRASTAMQNSRTWKKEVNRRVKNTAK